MADERHNGVTGIVKEKFYIPHTQWHVVTQRSLIRNVFIVVRAAGDPMALAGPVRNAIGRMDAKLPIAASAIPALRATRVCPVVALKAE